MKDLFITNVHIKNIRHLKDINISLSDTSKKHLIITGKNGSGKTSFLEVLTDKIAEKDRDYVNDTIIHDYSDSPRTINDNDLVVHFNNPDYNRIQWRNSGFVFAYCPAKRSLHLNMPKIIEAVDVSEPIMPHESASIKFVQYMLYLNYQKMSAITNKEEAEADKIIKWFERFTNVLRMIYKCPELELKHDSKNLSFKIIMPGYEPFALNELADGYSSLLSIVMELMIRMENKTDITYNIPGIVLIDEVEAHLHVELQKFVLPFLINMFPRMQFIVSTHSPFVITSVPNAVIFDLEKQEAMEDLSAYSYEGIIEVYFESDMYSQKATQMFEQYKRLIDKPNRNLEESRQLTDAIDYLEDVPPNCAKELVYAFREMERKRGMGNNGQA